MDPGVEVLIDRGHWAPVVTGRRSYGRAAGRSSCWSTIIVDKVRAVQTPAELTELFRDRGLKVTPQRQRIFEVLHRATMPTISLKTVYQTLNDLAGMGEIQVLDLGTGSGRFDPNVSAHHHLVCTSCGKVRDLHASYPELRVPPGQRQGFTVGSAEVVFRGVCDECRSKEASDERSNRRKGHG
ncbi:MAG: transcriptional repressor [Actinobacteria bacterium]|nr:MAG: transcriptional repressor [Actinomycetota bacterium]